MADETEPAGVEPTLDDATGKDMLATTLASGDPDADLLPRPPADRIGTAQLKASIAQQLFGREQHASARVGRYALLRLLGKGGMGVVYSAFDDTLDRKVALKLVREDVVDPVDGRARLTREAKALAKLQHPNVVGVYEVGTHDDQVFVAMEYVEGRTLRQWLVEDEPDVDAIVQVFVQAGRGLNAAHEAGLVHRDFKPDNVLIDHGGRVRVLDFGLARPSLGPAPALGPGDLELPLDQLTRTGALLGTPAYMAPEQIVGGSTGPQADQFSYCVALYEAVYGKRPFAARTADELTRSIEAGPNLPAARGIEGHVHAVLARGLSAAAGDRFPSMGELLAALDHRPRSRRRAWLAGVAGAAVFAGSAGVAAYASGVQEPGPACIPSAERLAGVWDDTVRERTHAAILSEGGAAAEPTWTAFERAMDDRVGEWRGAYDDACTSAAASDEGRAQLARQSECLDHALEELAIVSDIMKEPDARTIRVSAQAPRSTLDVELCADERAIAAFVALPEGEGRETFRALRKQVSRATLLGIAGAEKEAKAALEQAVAAAVQSGWTGLEAHARMRLAAHYDEIASRTSLTRSAGSWTHVPLVQELDAGFAAAQRGGQDVIAARIASMAARVEAGYSGSTRAGSWINLAAALVERTGDADARMTLELARAVKMAADGELDEASRRISAVRQEAMERGQTALAADAWRAAFNAARRARTNEREVAAAGAAWFEVMYGPQHPDVLAFRRVELENTISHGATARERREPTDTFCAAKDRPERASLCSELYHSLTDWPRAIEFADRAVQRFEVTGEDDDLLGALSWLGHQHQDAGDPLSAEPVLGRALELHGRLTPDQAAPQDLVASVARNYSALGKHDEAIDLLEDWQLRRGGGEDLFSAEMLGAAYLVAGRSADAVRLVPVLESQMPEAPLRAGEVQLLVAQILYESGEDRPRALQQLVEARNHLESDGSGWALRRLEEADAWVAEQGLTPPSGTAR